MESRIIKGRQSVWLASYYGAEDLINQQDACDRVAFLSPDTEDFTSYTKVGEADVTIYLASADEIQAGKVATLRAELKAKREAAAAEFMRIEDEISKLLAVTYEAPADVLISADEKQALLEGAS